VNITQQLEKHIDIRGTQLFVRSFGTDKNPTLLVVHGGPGGSHAKLLELNRFSDKFHVVFYDQRGTGNSKRFEDVNAESAKTLYSLEENIEDIEALRVHFGKDKLILIGHSWGGALATFYATKYSSRVSKLIVYSGGPEDQELATKKEQNHSEKCSDKENKLLNEKVVELERAIEEAWPQNYLDKIFSEAIDISYPFLYFKTPVTLSVPDKCGFWANMGAGAYIDSFDRHQFSSNLRNINCEVLLIWGRHEPSPQERLLYLRDNIPNSKLVIFENSGHNAMDEEPDLFFQTLEAFLGNSSTSGKYP